MIQIEDGPVSFSFDIDIVIVLWNNFFNLHNRLFWCMLCVI